MLPFLRTTLLKRGSTLVSRAARPLPRRNYATHADTAKAGSDLPWIIGSVAFTVPSVAYLMSSSKPHHSDAGHAKHELHKTVGETAEAAKQAVTDAASKASEKASELTGSAKEKAAKVTSGDTSKEDVKEAAEETVESAKETAGEAAEKTKETVQKAKEKASEVTEQAKDATSNLGEKAKEATSNLGEKAKAAKENFKDKVLPDDPEAPGAEKHPRLAAERKIMEENKKPHTDVTHSGEGVDAVTKEAGSMNTQTGKQEGLSDGNTFHAEFAGKKGQEISKKAEGVHDTAKLKGTVDPKRVGS